MKCGETVNGLLREQSEQSLMRGKESKRDSVF